jgi:hypothetical protein
MIKDCYEEAGENVMLSDACDLFEKDLTKLFWNELNAYELMLYNKEKYTFTYEKMKEDTFHILVENLRVIYDELSDLIDEVDAHRDVMVVRLKGHVDDRTNHIVGEAKAFAESPQPKIQKFNIEVTETVKDPMARFSANLPRPIRLDGKIDSVFKGEENGYQDISNKIENIATNKLKKMYSGTDLNEVMYDPDHNYDKGGLHHDHQAAVMSKIYQGSVLSGDPTQNAGVFMHHMTNGVNNPQVAMMEADTATKKRKLHNFSRRREIRHFGNRSQNERLRAEGFI